MNTTHVDHDALAALRAELTMAAGRRIRRRRAQRRTVVIFALIALLLVATAGGAAVIQNSTGVPAIDKLLDIEVPPGARPGPGAASEPLVVPEGDHRTNVVAFQARNGSICIATGDFHNGGVRGSFGGCPPLESVNRQVERRGASWGSFTLGLDARTFHMLVAGEVESLRPLVPGDWRVLMTPPWTPNAAGARPLRLVVLIDDRDYGNPDDGFQMDEMDAIPREASMPPAMKVTYRDGHTRVARPPGQAK
jgi:hypothetical protein